MFSRRVLKFGVPAVTSAVVAAVVSLAFLRSGADRSGASGELSSDVTVLTAILCDEGHLDAATPIGTQWDHLISRAIKMSAKSERALTRLVVARPDDATAALWRAVGSVDTETRLGAVLTIGRLAPGGLPVGMTEAIRVALSDRSSLVRQSAVMTTARHAEHCRALIGNIAWSAALDSDAIVRESARRTLYAMRPTITDVAGLALRSEMPIEVVGAAVAASGEDEAGDLLATWLAIPLDARTRILQVPESSVHGGFTACRLWLAAIRDPDLKIRSLGWELIDRSKRCQVQLEGELNGLFDQLTSDEDRERLRRLLDDLRPR